MFGILNNLSVSIDVSKNCINKTFCPWFSDNLSNTYGFVDRCMDWSI